MPVDEKTNEHKAAMELLESLVLEGRVIVGDAIFCQREVCEKIRDRGGHYFVVVKDNQPTLRQNIESAFVNTEAFSPPTSSGNTRPSEMSSRRSKNHGAALNIAGW